MNIWTLILIPVVVSIIANLLTPSVRSAIARGLIAGAISMRALGTWGIRTRIDQLTEQLNRTSEIATTPYSLLTFFIPQILHEILVLWLLLLATAVLFISDISLHPTWRLAYIAIIGGFFNEFLRVIVLCSVAERAFRFEEFRNRTSTQIAELKARLQRRNNGAS